MEFQDVQENTWSGGATINASSTDDFIRQFTLRKDKSTKLVHGHVSNVDFWVVEQQLHGNVPELGHVYCEDCDFRKCEELNPYKNGVLSSTCNSDKIDFIKENLSELEKEGLHSVVSFVSDDGTVMSNSKYNISIEDNKGNIFTKFTLNSFNDGSIKRTDIMNVLKERLAFDTKDMEDYYISSKYKWVQEKINENDPSALSDRNKKMETAALFYRLVANDNPEKIKFSTKDECLDFMEFMAKRAETLADENYNGNKSHWNFQAETFRKEAEIMKHSFYTTERCNIRVNHPSFEPHRLIYIQREAWIAKNVREKEKSIKQDKKEYDKLVKEQNIIDKRFFGLGKLIDRTLNRKNYLLRKERIEAIQKDINGEQKSLDYFAQNGRSMFDKKIIEAFKSWKNNNQQKSMEKKKIVDLSLTIKKSHEREGNIR